MLALKPKILTLHLEESEARALVTRGHRVERWASLPIRPGLISGGIVVDQRAVALIVRELLKTVKAGARKPLVSIGGLHPVVRTLTLPPLRGDRLVEAVQREMRRELPSPLEHYHISWRSLGYTKTETRIYALAVPSAELESHMAALKQAQLSPKHVSLEALAVASAVDSREAIIVGMKNTGFKIVVLHDGTATMMREITYRQEVQPDVDRIADLGRELQLTAASLDVDRPDDPSSVPLLYVIGKNTGDGALLGRLAQETGFPPTVFQPPAEYPKGFPTEEYGANLGLSLSQRRPLAKGTTTLTLNMVPERFRPKLVSWRQATAVIGLVVALGSAVSPLRATLEPDAEVQHLRSQVNRYERSISETRGQVNTARAIETATAKEQEEATRLKRSLEQVQRPGLLWTRVLRDSQEAFPDIELVTFSERQDKLTVIALAPSTTQAIAFATHLEQSGLFKSVTIPSLGRASQGTNGNGARFSVVGSKGD